MAGLNSHRIILHVDMDAFYASVEQRDNPSLKGRPVIVGADPKAGRGRGVVAACSYEARKFGVRSALPISQAWKLCPQGAYVPVRMSRYMEISGQVMEVLNRFTSLVEPLSIDEAFLDVTGSTTLFGPGATIARAIKKQIREETGLCASVGVAPNKFVAKIASDLKKPDGLVIVEQGEVETFLQDLPISRLWGVGPKTEARLREIGIHTILDIRARPPAELVRLLGNSGEHLHQLAFGRDERPVVPDWEARSISNETTFDVDTGDRALLLRTLRTLSESVGRRLRRDDLRARRITLKLRYEDFETHTRQLSLDRPTQSDDEIVHAATSLLEKFPLDRNIRLLGVGSGELVRKAPEAAQLELFEEPEPNGKLDRTVDEIRTRFGNSSLRRGSQL
jgi:nucleotidyltransferase/DNA polymerase involved in DNA repair